MEPARAVSSGAPLYARLANAIADKYAGERALELRYTSAAVDAAKWSDSVAGAIRRRRAETCMRA
eukprot:11213775-Lingulodinium_polyedra.AAC.1